MKSASWMYLFVGALPVTCSASKPLIAYDVNYVDFPKKRHIDSRISENLEERIAPINLGTYSLTNQFPKDFVLLQISTDGFAATITCPSCYITGNAVVTTTGVTTNDSILQDLINFVEDPTEVIVNAVDLNLKVSLENFGGHFEFDVAFSDSGSFKVPLWKSETPFGIQLNDEDKVGLLLSLELIFTVASQLEFAAGFNLVFPPGANFVLNPLSGEIVSMNIGDIQVNPIPFHFKKGSLCFTAVLRLKFEVGVSVVVLGKGFDFEAGLFLDPGVYKACLAYQPLSQCEVNLTESFYQDRGSYARAVVDLNFGNFSAGPTDVTTFFTGTLPSKCLLTSQSVQSTVVVSTTTEPPNLPPTLPPGNQPTPPTTRPSVPQKQSTPPSPPATQPSVPHKQSTPPSAPATEPSVPNKQSTPPSAPTKPSVPNKQSTPPSPPITNPSAPNKQSTPPDIKQTSTTESIPGMHTQSTSSDSTSKTKSTTASHKSSSKKSSETPSISSPSSTSRNTQSNSKTLNTRSQTSSSKGTYVSSSDTASFTDTSSTSGRYRPETETSSRAPYGNYSTTVTSPTDTGTSLSDTATDSSGIETTSVETNSFTYSPSSTSNTGNSISVSDTSYTNAITASTKPDKDANPTDTLTGSLATDTSLNTITIWTTEVYTVTACLSLLEWCPYSLVSEIIQTRTIIVYTTICPATQTDFPSSPPPAQPAAATTSTTAPASALVVVVTSPVSMTPCETPIVNTIFYAPPEPTITYTLTANGTTAYPVVVNGTLKAAPSTSSPGPAVNGTLRAGFSLTYATSSTVVAASSSFSTSTGTRVPVDAAGLVVVLQSPVSGSTLSSPEVVKPDAKVDGAATASASATMLDVQASNASGSFDSSLCAAIVAVFFGLCMW